MKDAVKISLSLIIPKCPVLRVKVLIRWIFLNGKITSNYLMLSLSYNQFNLDLPIDKFWVE